MKPPKDQMKLRIESDQKQKLQRAAARSHRSMNQQIVHYIEQGLKRDDSQEQET